MKQIKIIPIFNKIDSPHKEWVNNVKYISRKEYAKVWFKEKLNQMEMKDNIFFIGDEVVMKQDKKNEILWVNYKKIWSFFESEFNLNWLEIKDLIRDMVEEHFKMRSFKLLFF